jgi:hypothetical protein
MRAHPAQGGEAVCLRLCRRVDVDARAALRDDLHERGRILRPRIEAVRQHIGIVELTHLE